MLEEKRKKMQCPLFTGRRFPSLRKSTGRMLSSALTREHLSGLAERRPSMSYDLQEVGVSSDLKVWAAAGMGTRAGRGLGGEPGHWSIWDLLIPRRLSDIQAEVSRRWLSTSLEVSVKLLSAPNPLFSACSVITGPNPVNICILPSGMILGVLRRTLQQDKRVSSHDFGEHFWTLAQLLQGWHQRQRLAGSGARHPLMDGSPRGRVGQLCHCWHSAADILVSPGNRSSLSLLISSLTVRGGGWEGERKSLSCFLGRRKWPYQNKIINKQLTQETLSPS